jgi:hypothetical protein
MDIEDSYESKIKIYGPPTDKAINELTKLAETLPNISNGSLARGIIPSGETLMGDFDFVFHWTKKPDVQQLLELIKKIDEVLLKIGCRYTITSSEGSTSPYQL